MHDGHHDEGHIHEEHTHNVNTRAEAEAMLSFTLRHNHSHEEELHTLAHDLEALGLSDAALEVHYSLDDSRCASEHIERALAALAGIND